MGSKSPPCILEPLFASAQRGSKNPGFVLIPVFPYGIASLGVAYSDLSIRVVRAQVVQFEFVELVLLWQLDKEFPVRRFEAAGSQSTVLSPLSI